MPVPGFPKPDYHLQVRDYFHLHFHRIKTHPNHWVRKSIGGALVLGGILGPFLPILGLWMLPLGMILLAVDIPWVRRLNRRLYIRWGRFQRRHLPGHPRWYHRVPWRH